jgi:sulfotransferase family protein
VAKTVPAWEVDDLTDYRAVVRARLAHVVRVGEPLVLISQIQRSGGTLLLQLLDGHRECHVDPYELKIGSPKKHNWPPLDLSRPDTWFETLYFRGSVERLRRTGRTRRPEVGRSVFPYLFSPRLQKRLFDECVGEAKNEREILDAYFTSYFNAWLDNHNLYTGPKKAVVGFTPRLALDRSNVEHFFAAYPDGILISIVRDPRGWYRSAAKHGPEDYADLDRGLTLWNASADASLDAAERYGDRVLVLTYEQLVREPEHATRRVAARIGIEWSPSLLEPTFNGRPVRANSSDQVEREGILPERAEAFRGALDAATAGRIAELAGDRYERAAALV